MAHRIAVIPGDGIGKEVVPEGIRVLDAAGERFGILPVIYLNHVLKDMCDVRSRLVADPILSWQDLVR